MHRKDFSKKKIIQLPKTSSHGEEFESKLLKDKLIIKNLRIAQKCQRPHLLIRETIHLTENLGEVKK